MSTIARRLSPADQSLAEALLRQAPFAHVAMVEGTAPAAPAPAGAVSAGAKPYVVPMNFAYEATAAPAEAPGESLRDPGRLYLHTGEGRKSEALTQSPRVCVAITAEAAFDQGPRPCEDGFSFRSVLVEGRATLLTDRNERDRALRAIVAKYDPDAVDVPFAEHTLAETLVYAVSIETMSYRALPRRGTQ